MIEIIFDQQGNDHRFLYRIDPIDCVTALNLALRALEGKEVKDKDRSKARERICQILGQKGFEGADAPSGYLTEAMDTYIDG